MNSQKVIARNRYAVAEYDTMEEAAKALSMVGVMTAEEVMGLLRDRTGWINGFAIEYPGRSGRSSGD